MVLQLRRRSSGSAPDEGIYQCVITDVIETPRYVYVGLYNTGGGTIEQMCVHYI